MTDTTPIAPTTQTTSLYRSPEIDNVSPSRSPEIDKLITALAAAQGKFAPIEKNRTVVVTTKRGEKYQFQYATLDSVLAATVPALSENGLSITSTVSLDGICDVWLLHSSGQWMRSSARVGSLRDDPQDFGRLLTYVRRYLISGLLNVASEYDDDGNQAAGNEAIPQDPLQPLWKALDSIGVVQGPAIQKWCETALGRKVPSSESLTAEEVEKLVAIANEQHAKKNEKPTPPTSTNTDSTKSATPPPTSPPTTNALGTAAGMATEEQVRELNSALDALSPWGDVSKLGDKQAAVAKKRGKLVWVNGMMRGSAPIGGFRELSCAEIARLITAAKNGEVPVPEPEPAWMAEPQPKKPPEEQK